MECCSWIICFRNQWILKVLSFSFILNSFYKSACKGDLWVKFAHRAHNRGRFHDERARTLFSIRLIIRAAWIIHWPKCISLAPINAQSFLQQGFAAAFCVCAMHRATFLCQNSPDAHGRICDGEKVRPLSQKVNLPTLRVCTTSRAFCVWKITRRLPPLPLTAANSRRRLLWFGGTRKNDFNWTPCVAFNELFALETCIGIDWRHLRHWNYLWWKCKTRNAFPSVVYVASICSATLFASCSSVNTPFRNTTQSYTTPAERFVFFHFMISRSIM